MTMTSDPSIFRAYDIRGTYDESLRLQDAYFIGRAFASQVRESVPQGRTICVANDGRESSPALSEALCRGIQESGCHVVHIGLGPTPMLYFAEHTLDVSAGVMITGSHNPSDQNGFKLVLNKEAFFGDQIQAIYRRIEAQHFLEGAGEYKETDIRDAYLMVLTDAFTADRGLRVAWDSGNGATGGMVEALVSQLPGEHYTLFTEIDGTFPNHHPDPTEPANLEALIQVVKEHECDLGVAFDGDGDRIGVVDNTGEIIWGDQLLPIFARTVLTNSPGAAVIADVKASQMVFEEIKRLGGQPVMWKTGHSFIKSRMRELNAPLAGEMSGHIFFADKYYGYDDGLYAAVRLISTLASGEQSLSDIRRSLPVMVNTPEIRFHCADSRKFAVIEKLAALLKEENTEFNAIDGVRVNTPDGWWLLRASNTQPMLVARVEARDTESLKTLKRRLRNYIDELEEDDLELPE